MVADVIETRNVIASLEFKTWTTKKSLSFYMQLCSTNQQKQKHHANRREV